MLTASLAGPICATDEEDELSVIQHSLLQLSFSSSPAVAAKDNTPVTILDSCPLANFQTSMDWFVDNQLMSSKNSSRTLLDMNISASPEYYMGIAEQQCTVGSEWTQSAKPLIIDVGLGTTGTRWLTNVMIGLGFKVAHYAFEALKGTSDVDNYDFIADSEVSRRTWELAQSHPQAVFIMTSREPLEWQAARTGEHDSASDWPFTLPCGAKNNDTVGSENAPRAFMSYYAWAKCVLPADRILAVNFFSNETADLEFFDKLVPFLEMHGLSKPNWSSRVANVRATKFAATA
jgi:hypothetical protein